MNKILVVLSMFLLILAACSQTKTIAASNQELTAGIPDTEKTTTTSLEQLKTDVLAQNNKAENLFIPINIKKGKAGDTFVVGAVFNLVNLQPTPLLVKVDFSSAMDSMSNRIELSRDVANTWVEPIAAFTPKEGEPVFLPITIKTPANAASGTYTYDITMYKIDRTFQNQIESIAKKINIKVE